MKKFQLISIGSFLILLLTSANLFAQINFSTTYTPGGCTPFVVTINNQTTDPNAYSYQWNFNDGTPIVTNINPASFTYTYTTSGSFSVWLQVYNSSGGYVGNSYGNSGNIQVNGASIFAPDSICPTDVVNFCADNNANSWNWTFGDGGTSTQQCPQHTYTTIATYTVTLTENSFSCGTSTAKKIIHVKNIVPSPNFGSTPGPLCPTQPVSFNVYNSAKTYTWTFGDGSPVSNQPNPTHTYTAANTYSVTLAETNGCNNSASSTSTISIAPSQGFTGGVGAYCNWNAACPGQQVNLYVNASGNIIYPKYVWNFGDASPKDSSGSSVNHVFSTANTYTVSVKVTNFCGTQNTFTTTANIKSYVPFPNWLNLQANSPACPNSSVGFNAPNGYPTYKWNFGDGSPVQTTSINYNSHTYGSALTTYTASLTVTNLCGSDSILYKTVQVTNTVHFQNSNLSLGFNSPACPNSNVSFNVNSNGSNYPKYVWDFGDGSPQQTTSSNWNNHAYGSTLKTYTVSVKITNGCSIDTTISNTLIISNTAAFPTQNFNMYFNSPSCPNDQVSFNAPNGYSTYVWNFGDGSAPVTVTGSGNNRDVSHSYTAATTYTVSVKITNGCGHDTTISQSIIINNSGFFPHQNFGFNFTSPACPNSNVNFNAPNGYTSYEWNFGDGSPHSITTGNNVNYTYGSTLKTYTVSVKITNGCAKDTTILNTLVINGAAGFPNNPNQQFGLSVNSPACPNDQVNFNAPNGFNSYQWNYGDGSPLVTTTGNNNYSSHSYTTATTYTVSVKITNGCAQDTTIFSTLLINANSHFPKQNFSMNYISPACPNDLVNFNAPSGYVHYQWNFGDGTSASGSNNNANHTYTTTTTYTVSVKITNHCLLDTTIYITEIINNNGSFPNWMSIDANPGTSSPNDLITFRTNPQGFASYYWDFGDGNTITTTADQIQHGYASTGIFTVSCKVTNGCSKSQTVYTTVQVTLNAPVFPINLTVPNNPACKGDAVMFLVNQGQSTYTYAWNFGDGVKDTTIGGSTTHTYTSTATTYTVTLTAINGSGNSATTTSVVNISTNAYPVLELPGGGDKNMLFGTPGNNGSDAGCIGDVITFYFMGYNPNNLWDFGDGKTGIATQQMLIFGGDGTFPVTIIKHAYATAKTFTAKLTLTNHCGKSTTDSTHVVIGGSLLVNGQLSNSPPPYTTCTAIDFIAFGGANYKFNFGDGDTLSTSSPTASHIYAAQGNYVVSVLIINGCGNSASYSLPVNVSGVGGPSINISSPVNPSCLGNDGHATVNVSTGQAPYSYLWDNGQTTSTVTGLSAGNYAVTVTDNIGCPSSTTITLTNPAPIVLSASATQSSCGISNGTATVTITSGGTAPYHYSWSSGSTATTATGLSYGSYVVTVTDVNGCTASQNVSVSELNTAAVTLNSVTNTSCNGGSNGVIDINITGGTQPYTYSWSNGATTQDASNLAAGTYSVLVTDVGSCKATFMASVSQPAALVVATSVSVAPTCGNSDGKATVSATGGTLPYTYLWSVGSQTTQTATNLAKGTKSVTVTDAHGCSKIGTVTLSNANAPILSLSVTPISCNGANNGAIDLTIIGGTSDFNITWTGAKISDEQNIDSLSPGTYNVTVEDAAHCFSYGNYTITQPAVLIATVTNTGATCNTNDGTATATPAGGTSPYSYAWTGGQTIQTAVGLALGSRTVTVTDSKGCTTTATTSVTATTVSIPICLVTVDSLSQNNIITWTKPVVTNIDSFIIYREITTNNYRQIGAVVYDSLSMFKDTVRTKYFPNTGNPNAGTYRYKIEVRDACSRYSQSSPYHNTIYIINNSGAFSWPQLYTIEGSSNPVTSYNLMRDDNSTGIWHAVNSVAGTQQVVADPAYSTYSVTASWRVATQWSISCTPTSINPKDPEVNSISLNSSRSNVYRVQNPTDVMNTNADLIALVYPNPSSGFFTVDLKNNITGSAIIKVFNMLGEEVKRTNCTGCSNRITMDLSKLAGGVYYLQIAIAEQTITKKIVIE